MLRKLLILPILIFAQVICGSANEKDTKLIENRKKPILHIITSGRTGSVVLMRAIEAQGDYSQSQGGERIEIFNEPGAPAQALITVPELYDEWFLPTSQNDNKIIAKGIVNISKKRAVCIKDNGDPAKLFLEQNPEFVKRDNVNFVFLIREPGDVISSFYRAHGKFEADQIQWINLKSVMEIHELVSKHTDNIKIVFTHNLIARPSQTMQEIMGFGGLPFSEAAMKWESHGEKFDGKSWNDPKHEDKIKAMHKDAACSTCFKQMHAYEKNADGTPTFSEAGPQYRGTMHAAYKQFLVAYKYFNEQAARQ